MTTPDDVLATWFPEDPAAAQKLWWGADPATDAMLRERFSATLVAASAGELDDWAATPRGRLALVIVLDQLSRNLYRGKPEAFANDARARALTRAGLVARDDEALSPFERVFLYLPLEHSESLADQDECVALFRALAASVAGREPSLVAAAANYLDFAIRHRDIVARFGRFPHRNAALGRASSDEELSFLREPGSSF